MKTLNCLLLILFISTGCESNMQYPWITETPFQGILNSANGKLILIDFETEWWGWCDRLDADTYSNSSIISFAKNNLLSLKIDAEKGEGVELVKKYKVNGYPTIVFTNGNGDEIDRIVGYRPPEEFLKELKRIQSGINTLPALLSKLEQEPAKFSTLHKLINKYTDMDEKALAKEKINAILDADIDSAGTAAFLLVFLNAHETHDPTALIKYANENLDNGYTEKALSKAKDILRNKGDNPEFEAEIYLRYIESLKEPTAGTLNGFAWRMSELDLNLEIALEKIISGILNTTDLDQKYMFIDTKAEVLWKMGRVEEALIEIEICVKGKPEDKYYREQKEKFQHSMKKGISTSL